MKALRLSDKFMDIKRKSSNEYIAPNEILEEIPVSIKSVGHTSAYLRCLDDSHKIQIDNDFSALSLASSDTYTEKYLEFVGGMLDDFFQEQQRFILYSRGISKQRQEAVKSLSRKLKDSHERGESADSIKLDRALPEVPPRGDALLELAQLDIYCNQLNELIDNNLHKLTLTSQVSQL